VITQITSLVCKREGEVGSPLVMMVLLPLADGPLQAMMKTAIYWLAHSTNIIRRNIVAVISTFFGRYQD